MNQPDPQRRSFPHFHWSILMTQADWQSGNFQVQPLNEETLAEMNIDFVEAAAFAESVDGVEIVEPDGVELVELDSVGSDFATADSLTDIDPAVASGEAQAAADAAIEVGDYAAASQWREVAEDQAWDAGSDASLDGANSAELERATELQERASEWEQSQAQHAQAGDYEAARDDAQNAANDFQASDQLAGGNDHSGTAQLEVQNLDWAAWHQDISEDMLGDAIDYANDGNLSAAENSLGVAENQQTMADDFGDRGEHGHALADVAPAPAFESNDFNSYAVDTGSSADTSSVSDTSATLDTSSSADTSSSMDT